MARTNKCECGKQKTAIAQNCQKCYLKSKRNLCRDKLGKENLAWKGKDVGYKGLHLWVRANKPMSEVCEKCGKKLKLVVANISGKYKRDINDFMWLCYNCHLKYDDVVNKAWKTKGRFTEEEKREKRKSYWDKVKDKVNKARRKKLGGKIRGIR